MENKLIAQNSVYRPQSAQLFNLLHDNFEIDRGRMRISRFSGRIGKDFHNNSAITASIAHKLIVNNPVFFRKKSHSSLLSPCHDRIEFTSGRKDTQSYM